ncbi:MAG: hypothetical protein M1814_001554 [Vezdaea aestivalis]|nr:MAG: hypothetical protein M1814_001554 [Vezdaea aestivalis]
MKSNRRVELVAALEMDEQHCEFEIDAQERVRKRRRLAPKPENLNDLTNPTSMLLKLARAPEANRNVLELGDPLCTASNSPEAESFETPSPSIGTHNEESKTNRFCSSPITSPPLQLLAARVNNQSSLTLLSIVETETPETPCGIATVHDNIGSSPHSPSIMVHQRVTFDRAKKPESSYRARETRFEQSHQRKGRLVVWSDPSSSPLTAFRRSARRTKGQRISKSFEQEQGDEVAARYRPGGRKSSLDRFKGNRQKENSPGSTNTLSIERHHRLDSSGLASGLSAEKDTRQRTITSGSGVKRASKFQARLKSEVKYSVTSSAKGDRAFRLTSELEARRENPMTFGGRTLQTTIKSPNISHRRPWDSMYSPNRLKILTSSSLPSPPGHSGEPSPASDSDLVELRPFSTFQTPSPGRGIQSPIASSVAGSTPSFDGLPSVKKKARVHASFSVASQRSDTNSGILPFQEQYNEGHKEVRPRESALKKKRSSQPSKGYFDLDAVIAEAGDFLENWDVDTALLRASTICPER